MIALPILVTELITLAISVLAFIGGIIVARKFLRSKTKLPPR